MDHAAQLGLWVLWIAEFDCLGLGHYHRYEFICHAFLNQNSLDCGATLARVSGGTSNGNGCSFFKIGVA